MGDQNSNIFELEREKIQKRIQLAEGSLRSQFDGATSLTHDPNIQSLASMPIMGENLKHGIQSGIGAYLLKKLFKKTKLKSWQFLLIIVLISASAELLKNDKIELSNVLKRILKSL
ncbi:MAG: hypothetical protein H6567_13310 [Lewinellaceae bacterium]|nr:hypothetical protein [Lewinellaceae bacterium]